MKKLCCAILAVAAAVVVMPAMAQEPENIEAPEAVEATETPETVEAAETPEDNTISRYRRSSLYTMLIAHPDQEFGGEIGEVFLAMPTPDKFDDHSIGAEYKTITSTTGSKRKKRGSDANFPDIENHLASGRVPARMVARWFNRHPETGAFDMTLIQERGNYDATLADVALADMGARGRAVLADAGEELIGKTFLMVNDITYYDKSKATKAAGTGLRVLGVLGALATGDSSYIDLGETAGGITEAFGGFSVRITSYLYRLDWSEEVAATFYQDLWTDSSNLDAARVAAFDTSDLFRLTYIGSHSANAGNVTVEGFQEQTDAALISKVCVRALDRSIVELQRTYDEFKVNTPIHAIDQSGDVMVQIGLKEGINERSQFEVLEQIENEEGRTEYRRVGVIAPVKGQIWDNRYMAAEEAAEMEAQGVENTDEEAKEGNVNLSATRFRKVSGRDFYPGLLVREMTIRAQK
ncbi:MAG: hypothetical protein LBV18_04995 [Alistipes sp.]|jgi:hypothetical protein|nr:hypothetical protein [Alistipes sp.]